VEWFGQAAFEEFAREAVVKLALLVGSVLSALIGTIVLIARGVSEMESRWNR
jgi:hypothetical protein